MSYKVSVPKFFERGHLSILGDHKLCRRQYFYIFSFLNEKNPVIYKKDLINIGFTISLMAGKNGLFKIERIDGYGIELIISISGETIKVEHFSCIEMDYSDKKVEHNFFFSRINFDAQDIVPLMNKIRTLIFDSDENTEFVEVNYPPVHPGEYIELALKAQKITIQTLADKSGIDIQQIKEVLNGTKIPDEEFFSKIDPILKGGKLFRDMTIAYKTKIKNLPTQLKP